jgi:hypothetical protein
MQAVMGAMQHVRGLKVEFRTIVNAKIGPS